MRDSFSRTSAYTEPEHGCEVSAVRRAITQAGLDLRTRYPCLRFQSAIGLSILLASTAGVLTAWLLYWLSLIGAVSCIFAVALLTSLIHEIEHDTIHCLYFKNHQLIRSAMLLVGWLTRPNMPNPWYRAKIHLHHHKYSGRSEDIEEQAIGNGRPYSVLRFLVMADSTFAAFLIPQLRRNSRTFKALPALASLFPLHMLFTVTWVLALGMHLSLWWDRRGAASLAAPPSVRAIDVVMVIIIIPGLIRTFCIAFLSSSMHYFGGVDGVLTETQVLDHWYFIPFQLFAFWFGATHTIHHLVVRQPFYIRHAIRKRCYPAMRAAGVRFNDLGTFFRGNHYSFEGRSVARGLTYEIS